MNKEKTDKLPKQESTELTDVEMAQQAVLYINQSENLDDVTLIPCEYLGIKTYAVAIKEAKGENETQLTPVLIALNEEMFSKLNPLIKTTKKNKNESTK